MASALRQGDEPKYLQDKRRALTIAEGRIQAVDAELIAARDDRAVILRDIALFQESRAPVAQVPLEVLPLIFENWNDDPFTRNRTLCLVCKTWYEIVWNTTAFWTHIVLRPTWEIDKLDVICRFAQLCHQLSRDKLLDVVMDFSAVVAYGVYIGRVLDENSKRFPFVPQANTTSFATVAAQEDRHPYDEPNSYPYHAAYDQITKDVMRKLMEQNIEHVHRWRSLRIVMPADLRGPAAHLILHEMKGVMENLIEIDIMGSPNNGMSTLESIPRRLAYLANLRRLTTNQDIHFGEIRVNHSALTDISLKNAYASTTFIHMALSDFIATTTLELDFVGHINFLTFDLTRKAEFPQLTYLKLTGPAFRCQAALVQIEAPRLARLHLQQNTRSNHHFECVVAPLLSKVPSLLIQGTADWSRPRITPVFDPVTLGVSYSYEALKATLRQTNSLLSLRLVDDDWGDAENVRKVVTEVMEEEARPIRRLKEVIIVQDRQDANFLTEDPELLTVLTMPASTGNPVA
jgi:F-box-like